MYGKFLLSLCVTILFGGRPAVSDVSRQADDCTSGFMSMDRMEAAVQGGSESEDHVLGDVFAATSSINRQAILPYINFTCDGSILSWTFGAQWEGNSPRYTELQIWRSSGDGSYTKVGSTTIMLEEESSTRLYQYTLTSPLPFQAGDILGYFQGSRSTSQFRLLFEIVGSDHPLHYNIQNSPSSQFTIGSNTDSFDRYHLLIGVQTNSAGCDCGFMSLERMNILLRLDTVGDRFLTPKRQQIIRDINFTCDGLITQWILGADWNNNDQFYPELQVWRSVGNKEYHKINGTVINIASQSPTRIYEYDNFSPIPVQAGDILGVFIPRTGKSILRLWSELDSGPVVYYVDTGSATESPVDTIDLHDPLLSASYLPLVTVEIVASSPTSTVSLLITTSLTSASIVNDRSSTSTFLYPEPVATAPLSATQLINTMAASTTLPPHTTGEDSASINDVALFLGVGVAGTLLAAVITATVFIITVLVCLRKKTSKLNITDNVAYQSSTNGLNISLNAAYTATGDHSFASHYQEYMYVTTATADSQQAKTTTSIEATNLPTTTDEACNIPTSSSEAYAIPTSTNPSYVATITTSTNQAYQTV